MGENSQDNTQNGAPTGGLQKKTKIAYGVGAVGKDMVYMLVASYILYYYNSVLGVSSVFIGTVLMAARVFDAFNDPIMGIVVAKTRSRWGRFRPWIFSGTVLNAVVLYAMFAVPESMGAGGMKVFLTVTYFLWGITYTLMDIPYWSMIPAITEPGKERENLSALARSCAGVGSAIPTVLYYDSSSGHQRRSPGGGQAEDHGLPHRLQVVGSSGCSGVRHLGGHLRGKCKGEG